MSYRGTFTLIMFDALLITRMLTFFLKLYLTPIATSNGIEERQLSSNSSKRKKLSIQQDCFFFQISNFVKMFQRINKYLLTLFLTWIHSKTVFQFSDDSRMSIA